MIDFRYHLVSLVAVFLALAIGIVLGAGPLREGLATTLEDQVNELREERNQLRAELDANAERSSAREEALQQVVAPAVNATLTDISVGLLVLPGADRDVVQDVSRTVESAGGERVFTSELTDEAESADSSATRFEVATELAPSLDEPDPSEGGDPTFAAVLGAALSGAGELEGAGQWQAALDRMAELDLIETSWTETDDSLRQAPDVLLVVSSPLGADPDTEPEVEDALDQRTDILASVGDIGRPAVVLGTPVDEGDGDAIGSELDALVELVRTDSGLIEEVASVDHTATGEGLIATAYGVAQAFDGEVGHWGLHETAEATIPPVPPLREANPGDPEPIDPTLEGSEDSDDSQSDNGG